MIEKINAEQINASSLGRVYQHVQKESIKSWGIVTSYRDSKSKEDNEKTFSELKARVRGLGYGFFVLQGVGQEEDEKGNIRPTTEPSLFIPKITQQQIKELADQYEQWGYVYSGPEIDDKMALILKDKTTYLSKFSPSAISDFYSKVKGKRFTFVEATAQLWDKPANTYMERWYRYLQGYHYPYPLDYDKL
jgi:hypothetical protein